MSDINILLRNRESIKLQAMLEDMYYQLLVIEKQLANYR